MLAQDQEHSELETIKWLVSRGELLIGGTLSSAHTTYSPLDRRNYYYEQRTKKIFIVLHFTMGSWVEIFLP